MVSPDINRTAAPTPRAGIVAPRPSRAGDRRAPDPAPFRAADATALGWSADAREHAVATGRWARLRPGVFDLPPRDEPAEYRRRRRNNLRSARASAQTCSRAVISHSSAAIAYDLPTLSRTERRPCLTVQSRTALRELAHVHLHRATLREPDVCRVGEDQLTTVPRSVLDVAREHGVSAGVIAADAALHRGLTSHEELQAALATCAGWPGVAAARRTVEFADGLAESPLESLSRLQIAGAGLPRPKLQAEICDEYGVIVARSDFYWPEFGVVGEADGNLKYVDGQPVIEAQQRQEGELERLGLIVVRWGWASLFEFAAVVHRLRLSFARGARPGSPQRRWRVRKRR